MFRHFPFFSRRWLCLCFSLYWCLRFNAQVLVTLHQAVIPHLSNPIMLWYRAYEVYFYDFHFISFHAVQLLSRLPCMCSDFLTRSYDIGGVISVMALSSLYVLMTEHGLEYPNFYEKLYVLLEPSIFMAKHRSKFFQVSIIISLLFYLVKVKKWNQFPYQKFRF